MYELDIKNAITYIEENLHKPITLNKFAQECGYSKYHFHRIFQSEIGMTVIEYIRLRRLANASITLLHTDERIIDIALTFQFNSQEAFTEAFKEVYKLPPGKYRRIMKTVVLHKEDLVVDSKIKGWFLS